MRITQKHLEGRVKRLNDCFGTGYELMAWGEGDYKLVDSGGNVLGVTGKAREIDYMLDGIFAGARLQEGKRP